MQYKQFVRCCTEAASGMERSTNSTNCSDTTDNWAGRQDPSHEALTKTLLLAYSNVHHVKHAIEIIAGSSLHKFVFCRSH